METEEKKLWVSFMSSKHMQIAVKLKQIDREKSFKRQLGP